ncbi:MAG: PDZ domain-containing protein [Planctomycetaceae bacterium]|jgi:hypothetical protein|nr:PDZ domain-containing protein [Planctomycetaceae bacterium]
MTYSKTSSKIFRQEYFCLVFLFFLAVMASTQQAVAQKIHLIIAADTNASGGVGAITKIDHWNVKQLFESNIPCSQLNIVTIPAEEMRESDIFKTVDSLDISNEDTLVFYYSGHGAFDRQNQQQFLQLSLGNVYRSELLKHIVQKSPRLSILLTDCCNVQVDSVARERQSEITVFPQEISPLFKSLFIYCKGVVDITSSKLGEYSFCDNKKVGNRGSCFTYPLVDLMKVNKDNAQMDWNQLITELSTKVDEAFKELYPNGHTPSGQMSQTIVAADYPGKNLPSPPAVTDSSDEKKSYRFGVRAAQHQGGGMRMLEIISDSPAERSGLEVGDVILEINGKTINTEQDYSDAVDASGKKMQVKLINIRDGKTMTPTIELGW